MPRILLAEDDTTMVSLLKTLLRMEGFDVLVMDSEAEIIATARRERPDIILMDVHLTHHNGLDVLKKMRAMPDGRSMRVLMTSGLDFKEQCLANGADGFIQKPFMPDDLVDALRNILKQ